jgi:hypothetical protein
MRRGTLVTLLQILVSQASLSPVTALVRVIALDLVKICNFQHVSHVTQKGFDIES